MERLSQKLRWRLKKFELAAINRSWKGSTDPEDWEVIENEYRTQKRKLCELLLELEQGAKK